jgi:hypothetical protein
VVTPSPLGRGQGEGNQDYTLFLADFPHPLLRNVDCVAITRLAALLPKGEVKRCFELTICHKVQAYLCWLRGQAGLALG